MTPIEHLDLATVLKVSQAVSGETDLEKLIATILRLSLEHAGADRGLLILPSGDTYRIKAEAKSRSDGTLVELRLASITSADLPESVFHNVLRTRESVLLQEASGANAFSDDEYMRRHRVRSVVCLPLLKQTQLVGVIYLENRVTSGALTAARMALLELLPPRRPFHWRMRACIAISGTARPRSGGWSMPASSASSLGIPTVRSSRPTKEFLRIIGYRREDLISGRLRWTDFTLSEWRERDARVMEEQKEGGAAQAQERELLRKDGSRVPVLTGGTLFYGTPDEGVAFVVDLTERKRAEQAVRERESRVMVDTIPGLVAILTPAGDVDVVNHELVEYCGQPLEAMRQWGMSGTVHSDDLPHVGQVFTQAIAAGDPYDFEARIRRFDGIYRWGQVRGLPLRDTNGRIARWYVVLTDIDQRKRAEDALRASERSLKLIIDTIPALAWSARPDGSAEFFNQHYLNFIGLSAKQASGWGWMAAVHPDDLNDLSATWQRIKASEAPGEAEARLRRHERQLPVVPLPNESAARRGGYCRQVVRGQY